MKISTQIEIASSLVGEEKAVLYVARAGFDAWDFSMFEMGNASHPLSGENYLAFARKLKRIGLDNGIVCNQSHAPFPPSSPEVRSYFKRAIECTAEAGGEICVIHPDNDKGPEENAEMYLELLPFAKEHNVKIAAENMWNWDFDKDESCFAACASSESFVQHLDAVNDDYLVACLDIGHAEMRGSGDGAANMVRALGHRLKALHIHDNDRWHDNHQIPFSMSIDYPPIVAALKEIGYDGWFTLEADLYLTAFNADNVLEGMKDLAKAARRLADMFEKE